MNNTQQELYRFLRPMLAALGKLISYLHWWIFVLFGAYLASNIVIIQPDEVGLVLRFGRVVDGGTSKAVKAELEQERSTGSVDSRLLPVRAPRGIG